MSKVSEDTHKDTAKESDVYIKPKRRDSSSRRVDLLKSQIRAMDRHSPSRGSSGGPVGLVVSLIGLFVFAIVATSLLPMIAEQVAEAQGGNLTDTDMALLDLWPTFIIIGGLLTILVVVGLS